MISTATAASVDAQQPPKQLPNIPTKHKPKKKHKHSWQQALHSAIHRSICKKKKAVLQDTTALLDEVLLFAHRQSGDQLLPHRAIHTPAPTTPMASRAYQRPLCHWRAATPHTVRTTQVPTNSNASTSMLQAVHSAQFQHPVPLLPYHLEHMSHMPPRDARTRCIANQAAHSALQHRRETSRPQWHAWSQQASRLLASAISHAAAAAPCTSAPQQTELQQVLHNKIAAIKPLVHHARAVVLYEALVNGDQLRPSAPPHLQWSMLLTTIQHVASHWQQHQAQHQATSAALNQAVLAMHGTIKEQVHQAREAARRARLQALRAHDMAAYLALVATERSHLLQEALAQTDECLQRLARRLPVSVRARLQAAVRQQQAPSSALDSMQQTNDAWRALAASLQADITTQPTMLCGGQLPGFQMQGLRWMVGLFDAQLNGILADEMGLGKTVQVLALVCYYKQVRTVATPSLVLVPASVLPNWQAEAALWAPALRVLTYCGPAAERQKTLCTRLKHRDFDLVLTTYEMAMGNTDRPLLASIQYNILVVDEGHRVKRADCKLAVQLRYYKVQHRLLLTGTPVQNNLHELWGLLNFIMPDMFGNAQEFDDWFGTLMHGLDEHATPLSEEEQLLITTRLHQVLCPFMLRRLKQHVLGDTLPRKFEYVLHCPMSAYQQHLCSLVHQRLQRTTSLDPQPPTLASDSDSTLPITRARARPTPANPQQHTAATAAQAGKTISINNAVMELRTICNHPLVSKLHPPEAECSMPPHPLGLPPEVSLCGKTEVLDRLFTALYSAGSKVLLFCTMTRVLDVLADYLDWRGMRWLRLDGGTKQQERGAIVSQFNDPDSNVFVLLLSLRAGGVGLNLQAADTVILYDTDWNPQQDLQAQARAHRMGQQRDVRVVRLVTRNSIEQHMVNVADQKRCIADATITGGFFDGTTSFDARRDFLLELLASHHARAQQHQATEQSEVPDAHIEAIVAYASALPEAPTDGVAPRTARLASTNLCRTLLE